jgi:hypothetical protein
MLVGKELRRRRSHEVLRCVARRSSHAERSRAVSSASFLSYLGLPWETIEWYDNEAIMTRLLGSL